MEFCVAILILNTEGNMQHFLAYYAYYFKKRENATEMQKQMCAVCGEGAVNDQMCQK